MPGRQQFEEEGERDRVDAGQRQPRGHPQPHQHRRVRGERRGERDDPVRQQRPERRGPAPEPVGHRPPHQHARDHAERDRRQHHADARLVDAQLGAEVAGDVDEGELLPRLDDERDEQRERDEHVPAGERHAVERLADGHRAGVDGGHGCSSEGAESGPHPTAGPRRRTCAERPARSPALCGPPCSPARRSGPTKALPRPRQGRAGPPRPARVRPGPVMGVG